MILFFRMTKKPFKEMNVVILLLIIIIILFFLQQRRNDYFDC